jgi:hypothetical protein
MEIVRYLFPTFLIFKSSLFRRRDFSPGYFQSFAASADWRRAHCLAVSLTRAWG